MSREPTAASAVDLLNRLEQAAPVESWRVGGLQVWPMVRFRIGRALAERHLAATRSPSRSRWSRATVRLKTIGSLPRLVDRAPLHEADVLALSNGFLRPGHGSHGDADRLLEPVLRALDRQGMGSRLLVPGSPHGRVGRDHEEIQGLLDASDTAAALAPVRQASLPGHDRVADLLEAEGMAHAVPTRGQLGRTARAVELTTRRFQARISRSGARLGLVVDYYNRRGAAFVLACRREGVACVDVQHGLQGPLHHAYGGWTTVPPSGWELLPSHFLVWSNLEAEAIGSWGGTLHQAIVGGRVQLEEPDRPLSAPARRALATESRDGLRVLVTLHGEEAPDELERLRSAIVTSPSGWRWWIRCHPTRPQQQQRLRSLLADVPVADIEHATQSPLDTLLMHADVHLTAFSSVVLDACAYGMASVLTSSVGAEIFAEQVAAGTAVLAMSDVSDLHQVLERQARRRQSGVKPPSALDPAAIDTLLELIRSGPMPPEAAGTPRRAGGRRSDDDR